LITSNVSSEIKGLSSSELDVVINDVASLVNSEGYNLTPERGNCFRKFMSEIPHKQRITLWSKATVHGVERIDIARWIFKYSFDLILETDGIPRETFGLPVNVR
jgi:hypothetical protein